MPLLQQATHDNACASCGHYLHVLEIMLWPPVLLVQQEASQPAIIIVLVLLPLAILALGKVLGVKYGYLQVRMIVTVVLFVVLVVVRDVFTIPPRLASSMHDVRANTVDVNNRCTKLACIQFLCKIMIMSSGMPLNSDCTCHANYFASK